MLNSLIMIVLLLTAIFLILLILVQRGRGGGLVGALGGMGGQSAFGTKAGDFFTKVTIGVVAFWIILCAFSVRLFSVADDQFADDMGSAPPVQSATDAQTAWPAGGATPEAPAADAAAGAATDAAGQAAGEAEATAQGESPGSDPPESSTSPPDAPQ